MTPKATNARRLKRRLKIGADWPGTLRENALGLVLPGATRKSPKPLFYTKGRRKRPLVPFSNFCFIEGLAKIRELSNSHLL
jgi:hypothetical protein